MQKTVIAYFMMFLICIGCSNKIKSDFETNIDYYNEISSNILRLCRENSISDETLSRYEFLVILNADICSCHYNDIDNALLKLKEIDSHTLLIAIDKNNYLVRLLENLQFKYCKIHFNMSTNISKLGFDFPHQIIYRKVNGDFIANDIF